MPESQNVLISLSDKTGVGELAGGFRELDWNLIASGGTAAAISEAGFPVTDVAELVGSEAILDHRVVTISQEVHAGLLADPRIDMHVEQLERLGIPFLSAVCVDMYPLRQAVEDGLSERQVINKTDVGGPAMLHSAAKGRRIALSLPSQRPVVLEWLRVGRPDEELVLRALAATAERQVSDYIGQSADYLDTLVRQNDPKNAYEGLLRQIGDIAAAAA